MTQGITRRASLAGMAAVTTLVGGMAASATPSGALARRLRAHCETLAEKGGLSGAVLLAEGGAPTYRAAFGLRNRPEGLANLVDTKFNFASMGKLFTSLAIMRLVQAGRIELGDKLERHWPDYPNSEIASSVTIGQLLSHTSGLGNYWEAMDRTPAQHVVSVKDALALFSADGLSSPPGSFFYSNSVYVVLGGLIERLTGEDYFEHIKKSIFLLLGMNDTDFYRLDRVPSNLAIGYERDSERRGAWRSNSFDNVFRGGPAGGGYSTVDDLLLFANAMRRGELLSPEAAETWTTGRVDYQRGRYGYGVSEEVINGHRIIGHSGGHIGIAGELMIFVDLDRCFIILTNSEVDGFWDINNWIKREIAGDSEAGRAYYFSRTLIDELVHDEAAGRKLYASRATGLDARPSVIGVYGLRKIHEGRIDAGLALLRFNAQTFPEPDTLWSFAEGLRLSERLQEAAAAYEVYLEQAPGDADALARLSALQQQGVRY